jgi:hypothetical protein
MPRISSPTSPMRWTRSSDRTERDMDERSGLRIHEQITSPSRLMLG